MNLELNYDIKPGRLTVSLHYQITVSYYTQLLDPPGLLSKKLCRPIVSLWENDSRKSNRGLTWDEDDICVFVVNRKDTRRPVLVYYARPGL